MIVTESTSFPDGVGRHLGSLGTSTEDNKEGLNRNLVKREPAFTESWRWSRDDRVRAVESFSCGGSVWE